MKSLLCLFVFLASLYVSSASLIDALNAAHNSPAFKNLTHPEQLLIIELLAETEAGELKQYIDSVGFHNVLAVIDKLPQAEAHLLTNYLINELAKEENQGSGALGKRSIRSLVEVLNTAKADPAFQQLSQANQTLIIQMLTAAENNTLTAHIDQIGYSTVLRIIDMLPVKEKHLLEQYIFQHLRAEMHLLG
ncbi:uncharacterized protein LOC132737629 [Ruditapes philippinarum]|uniref:uncharacterized protein LOC132737629 n=1 Tax=Ruditapes philippinarum TaxID=129788 RepID=UPI00295BA90F|nr:uncharacterized protein LOC132737629 [Ruditapes philippinarum]